MQNRRSKERGFDPHSSQHVFIQFARGVGATIKGMGTHFFCISLHVCICEGGRCLRSVMDVVVVVCLVGRPHLAAAQIDLTRISRECVELQERSCKTADIDILIDCLYDR